jgi:hypothetical protein
MGENLRFFTWLVLVFFCLFAVGSIRNLAARRNKPHLLWLLLLPSGPLVYIAFLFLRRVMSDLVAEWRETAIIAWVILTLWLWVRGERYKQDAKRAQEDAQRTWEMLKEERGKDKL